MSDQQQPVEVPEEAFDAAVEALAKRRWEFAQSAGPFAALGASWEQVRRDPSKWEQRDKYLAPARREVELVAPILTSSKDKLIEELEGELRRLRCVYEQPAAAHEYVITRNADLEYRLEEARALFSETTTVVDALFDFLAESGLAEGGLPLYEAMKPVAEVRAKLATLDTSEEGGDTEKERCHRCGRVCTVWFASSPLWNAVIRGGSINGDPEYGDMVCATCFMQLAEEKGIATRFRVTAEEVAVELETVTPSGRVWDQAAFCWLDHATDWAGQPLPDSHTGGGGDG